MKLNGCCGFRIYKAAMAVTSATGIAYMAKHKYKTGIS